MTSAASRFAVFEFPCPSQSRPPPGDSARSPASRGGRATPKETAHPGATAARGTVAPPSGSGRSHCPAGRQRHRHRPATGAAAGRPAAPALAAFSIPSSLACSRAGRANVPPQSDWCSAARRQRRVLCWPRTRPPCRAGPRRRRVLARASPCSGCLTRRASSSQPPRCLSALPGVAVPAAQCRSARVTYGYLS